jgi:hypothetical protein
MATIVNTLIDGLTSQMVQARINSVDAKTFLFGTHSREESQRLCVATSGIS